MMQSWKKWCRSLAAFGAARGGNVAITFAFATIPILGAVGVAVDYSKANSVKAGLQAALDSTALMLSKNATTDTADQLQLDAQKYFNALFTRTDVKNVTVTANYTTTGGSALLVNGSAEVPTYFMGAIGHLLTPGAKDTATITIGGSSTAKWGSTRLRVALVLDNTGSMSQTGSSSISKMEALKTATNNLLTQLKNAATNNGDVDVSIIPFVKDTNLDPSNYSSTWIDWTSWADEPPYIKTNKPSNWSQIGPGSSCPFSTQSYGFTCTADPTNGSSKVSTIPSSGTYAGYICPGPDNGRKLSLQGGIYYNGCYNSVKQTTTISSGSNASCGTTSNCSCTGSGSSKACTQTYYAHTWIPNATSTWNGCVADRGDASVPSFGNYDTNVVAPSTLTATQYPAEQYSSCPQASMGLSYDWSSMTTLVTNMSAAGNTNQAIGLQAGWMSLVGGGPFTAPAMDPNYTYQQIIILLTDGLNTEDRWYDYQSAIDTRQQKTCDNINAAGVTLYTIQVDTGGDPTSTLLQNCAGSPDKYPDPSKFFLLTTPDQIVTTFQSIADDLTQLRVAK